MKYNEKDPDAGKDWGQEEKKAIEDEMVGWHHWLDGHEFEPTPGDNEGQGRLACCSPWGCKESDMLSDGTTMNIEDTFAPIAAGENFSPRKQLFNKPSVFSLICFWIYSEAWLISLCSEMVPSTRKCAISKQWVQNSLVLGWHFWRLETKSWEACNEVGSFSESFRKHYGEGDEE